MFDTSLLSPEEKIAVYFVEKLKPYEVDDICEWIEENFYLSPEASDLVGSFSFTRSPHLKEICRYFLDRRVKEIYLRCGVQLAKTTLILIFLLVKFVFRKSSGLCVFPTQSVAEDKFSSLRLSPMIRDCPILHDIFPKNTKEYTDKKSFKKYQGGSVIIAHATPENLVSLPIKDIVLDEASLFPIEVSDMGDPFELAKVRQSAFEDTKFIAASSPRGQAESCHITRLSLAASQHERAVPCPHCKTYIALYFDQFTYDDENPYETAKYTCQECEEEIFENHKADMLEAGRWECQTPERSMSSISFNLNGLHSPFVRWGQIAKEWAAARAAEANGMAGPMRTFINTRMCENDVSKFKNVDYKVLFDRKENYPAPCPEGVLVLTAGVDVNDNDLCCEIVGWGEGGESWSIDYFQIVGDPMQDDVWQKLEDHIFKDYMHEWGFELNVSATGVDQGHIKKMAEAFVKKNEAKTFYAIKGAGKKGDPFTSDKPIIGSVSRRTFGKNSRKVNLYNTEDCVLKHKVMSDLRQPKGEANYCHFPDYDHYTEKHFKYMCAEKLIQDFTKSGYSAHKWEKPRHLRNEPLDCRKYAYVAKELYRPVFEKILARHIRWKADYDSLIADGKTHAEAKEAANGKAVVKKRVRPKTNPWVNGWR